MRIPGLTLLLYLTCSLVSFAYAGDAPPQTVARVDLLRYAGLWYEISKLPNRFQDQCVTGTTAEYRLRADGRMEVTNSCITPFGERDTAQGIARVVDTISNAKLEVSFVKLFGWQLFWGDYWILALGADYAYAVVGTPNHRYGWVLSRTPELDQEALQQVQEVLHRNGYDPADFQPSPQTPIAED